MKAEATKTLDETCENKKDRCRTCCISSIGDRVGLKSIADNDVDIFDVVMVAERPDVVGGIIDAVAVAGFSGQYVLLRQQFGGQEATQFVTSALL